MDMTIEKKVSIYKKRFEDAMWFDWLQNREIVLLGAGAIGSWTALCLSRIGCKLHIYDMDTIEAHNLGGQLFSTQDVGSKKTEITAALCAVYSGAPGKVVEYGEYNEKSFTSNIVISGLDNMKTRKLAFEKWVNYIEELEDEEKKTCIFIDGRLMAESYQVYGVTPDKIEEYRATLFEDATLEEALCTLKSTTHCSMGVAKEIASILTNFAANKAYGADVREVPFKISHEIVFYKYEIT